MEHPQRETALGARDLIVIELHRIDRSAPEFIILSVRSKNGTEKNASVTSFGMDFHVSVSEDYA